MDRVAQKLQLQPGDTHLDIGCGKYIYLMIEVIYQVHSFFILSSFIHSVDLTCFTHNLKIIISSFFKVGELLPVMQPPIMEHKVLELPSVRTKPSMETKRS
jgi:hypothetical protein